jgi:hypothetical protein
MRQKLLAAAAVASALTLGQTANAGTLVISAIGNAPGISGNLTITYGPSPDFKYPQAFEVTGITGMISDAALGFANVSVNTLVPINPVPGDPLAPADFSRDTSGFSYDNLVWPGGSAIVCTGFDSSGTVLDVYGVLFTLQNGDTVDLWGNGLTGALDGTFGFIPGGNGIGIKNLTTGAEDYVAGSVILTVPEPATWALFGVGFLGLGLVGLKRQSRRADTAAA